MQLDVSDCIDGINIVPGTSRFHNAECLKSTAQPQLIESVTTPRQEEDQDTEDRQLPASQSIDKHSIRDPFCDRPYSVRQNLCRQSKRTQRYRSTASSRITSMTVGDIRYCFQQLRNAGDTLTSDLILYNGQTAGAFALAYLTETSNAMRRRRKKKGDALFDENDQDADMADDDNISIETSKSIHNVHYKLTSPDHDSPKNVLTF
jgi:hypothetical protein